jgi:hypothetical protein
MHIVKPRPPAEPASSPLKTFLLSLALGLAVPLVLLLWIWASDSPRSTHQSYSEDRYELDRKIYGDAPALEKAIEREYEYQRSR